MPPRKKKDEQLEMNTEVTETFAVDSSSAGNETAKKTAEPKKRTTAKKTTSTTKKSATAKTEGSASTPPDSSDSGAKANVGNQLLLPPPEKPKAVQVHKKTIFGLNLNELDRDLSAEQQQEWSAIYASYRAKSMLSGTVIGADQNTFNVMNRESGENERKTLSSLIIIDYRVKVLIPESEMWAPGEERPSHVLRNMVGSKIDYVILEIDREGECAIGSRRLALATKRHYFSTARTGHNENDPLTCQVLAVGPKRCLVECNGYDISLSQKWLSYTAIPDLRTKYRPGQELPCLLKEYDKDAGKLFVSVKEVNPNPFIGADIRHPIGSRRQAVISGKYAGGVFCTLPDDTTCLCLYSAQHDDGNFSIGDGVIIVIRQYEYDRQLIFGRILAKW